MLGFAVGVEDRWADLIRRLSNQGLSGVERDRLLAQALSLGATITADSVGCSVTEDTGAGFRTPAASNALALRLDHAQYEASDGPCVAACRDGLARSITIMSDEGRYSRFTAAALDVGVRSSLSLPLSLPSLSLSGTGRPSKTAALNLYAGSPQAFETPHARAVAALLARCVAAVLTDVAESERQAADRYRDRPLSDLQQAHRHGRLVRAAQRTIAADLALDEHAAFTELTRRSRSEQRSILAVARDILSSTATRPAADPAADRAAADPADPAPESAGDGRLDGRPAAETTETSIPTDAEQAQ
jgi:hypothetical protein